MKSLKTVAVCLTILSLALVPELARAGLIKGILDACRSFLSQVEGGAEEPDYVVGQANSEGVFSVEISDVNGQAYVYDISQDKSELHSLKDRRILTILTDDLTGNIDSSQHIGYIDSSWSPDGQILLLVDGYGNIEAHDLGYFQELLRQKRQNPNLAKQPIRTKIRRHAGVINMSRGGIFIPNIKWLSTRTVEVRSGSSGVALVATITDDGVVGLRVSSN